MSAYLQWLERATVCWVSQFLLVCACVAQPHVLSESTPQRVFAGRTQEIRLRITGSNVTATNVVKSETQAFAIHAQLLQLSSATAAQVKEWPWKVLTLLPGQTLLETASIELPAVRAETRFLVRWLIGTNQLIGSTELLAYPQNLLKTFSLHSGPEPPGLFDPQGDFIPAFKAAKLEFTDLQDTSLENFTGKLLLVNTAGFSTEKKDRLAAQTKALVAKGAGVIWIDSPSHGQRDAFLPSYHLISEGTGRIVVVQPGLVTNLSSDPGAQLTLLHCISLAAGPQNPWPPRFP